MAKSRKKNSQAAAKQPVRTSPAPQPARTVRPAGSSDSMSAAQRVAWVSLHLLIFITPLIIANWTWLGFDLPFTYDQFDIMKVLAQRVFTLIAFGAWAWDIFTRGGRIRLSKIDYLVLALLGWVLLTTITSIHPPTALFGKYRRFEGLLAFVNYAAVFFLVMQFADRASRIRSLARTLFYSGTLVSLYGVLQYVGTDFIRWGNLPFDANRAFSTYGNPDLLGGYIVFPLIISLALALSEEDTVWRSVYWVGFLTTVACWIVAFTRGSWVGGAFGLVIFFFVAFRHTVRLKAIDWGFIGATFAAGTALVIRSLSAESKVMNVWLRLQSIFDPADASSASRLQIWQAAIDAIKARPILGFGADTFRLVFPRYKPAEYVEAAGYLSVADNVHNYPLQITAALGIPGFVLLYGTFGAAAWFSAPLIFGKREGTERLVLAGFWTACAAYLGTMMFGLSVTGSTVFLWISMAVVLAPVARVVEVRSFSWGTAAAAVSLVLVGLLLIGSFVYTSADSHYLKARIVARGDGRVAEAKRAIELNPYNDMYRTELALAYVDNAVGAVTALQSSSDDQTRAAARAAFETAERELKSVIEFVPWEYDNYVFIVNLYTLGGRYLDEAYLDDGVEWGLKGIEVEEYGPAIKFQLANVYVLQGEYDLAYEQVAYAVDLDPNYSDAWVLLGEIEIQRGNEDAAVKAFETALARKPELTSVRDRLEKLQASMSAEATGQ